jgi:4-hydroxy-tetrahydrodipicolinate reductase
MNIVLSGYGRMGREVEKVLLSKNYKCTGKIDTAEDWEHLEKEVKNADAVIDFSLPETVVKNILRCFESGVPVVTGTTGWYDELDAVKLKCDQLNGTLFYAPNFSLGVNLFFMLNKKLAGLMSSFRDYKVFIEEIHHIHKLDSPSGTAIKLARDIISKHEDLMNWENNPETDNGSLPIFSKRMNEVPGTHAVNYVSMADRIELKHEALNRSGFAVGAVTAAEWVAGKKGVFTMDDMLNDIL